MGLPPYIQHRIDWTKADLSGATKVAPERSALVQSIRIEALGLSTESVGMSRDRKMVRGVETSFIMHGA